MREEGKRRGFVDSVKVRDKGKRGNLFQAGCTHTHTHVYRAALHTCGQGGSTHTVVSIEAGDKGKS